MIIPIQQFIIGQIYNAKELRNELIEKGFSFDGHCDTEVLIKSYVYWGYDVVRKLNGIFGFAIWDSKKEELFLARDHFGIKPLYYTISDDNFIFASEIKAILKHPHVEACLDSTSICELFGIGPAHTPGTSVFKNIKELEPAHFAVLNKSGIHFEKYWELISRPHTDSFDETCQKVRFLLDDAIRKTIGF